MTPIPSKKGLKSNIETKFIPPPILQFNLLSKTVKIKCYYVFFIKVGISNNFPEELAHSLPSRKSELIESHIKGINAALVDMKARKFVFFCVK